MGADESDIYKLDGELDDHDKSVVISFYVEYKVLISNVVNAIEG